MRLLLFVVGVGAGNTTRNLALLEELKRQAPEIDLHIAAQGKAFELLSERYEVHPLQKVSYSEGGEFSSWNMLKSNLSFPLKFLQNRSEAKRLMTALTPDVVAADSDFYCLGPAKRLGIPLATINNSPVVVAQLREFGIPEGCGFSAKYIERTDSWLQHRYADRVICPVIEEMEGLDPKVHQIPPIVRPDFLEAVERNREADIGEDVVVVTGGSGIGVGDIDLSAVEAPMTTYGSKIERLPSHARQEGFTLRHVEAMSRAKVIVVQGGFSSVSEAVALRRPTVVVPITRHAEQHMNAYQVERLGLGLAAPGPQAGANVNEILERYEEFDERCRASRIAVDGHVHAAKALLQMGESK